MKFSSLTIQMRAIEKYFPAVLYILLCKMALTFDVDEILKYDTDWNESYWALLSNGVKYSFLNFSKVHESFRKRLKLVLWLSPLVGRHCNHSC